MPNPMKIELTDRQRAELEDVRAHSRLPYLRERAAVYPGLTGRRLWRELRELGYEGGYAAVRRYARSWAREHASQMASASVDRSSGGLRTGFFSL